jgi:hypothetical protein
MKMIFASAVLFIGFSIAGQAAVIFDTTSVLTNTDPTQIGRLSRNSLAQDWSGSEAFPGVLNTTTSYYYTTYSINVSPFSYIQIEMDSLSANTFASAYLTSYMPDSAGSPNFGFNTDWLGDAGSSGNYFGTDPIFLQVIVPAGQNLVLVVNNTAAGGVGLGDPFHLTVEGFYDANFDETPEPTTVLLVGGGLAAAGLITRLRKRGSAT